MAISAGVAFIKILGDFSGFAKSVDAGLRKMSPKLATVGKNMTKFVTLPILAAGAASVAMAVDFEKSMTQIQALAGQSQKQVGEWGEEILALAPKVGAAPKELAEALYFVASSGVDVSHAMEIVEISAKAAATGLGDTATVADLVTSAMNAYATTGLSAAEATDTLVEAVRLGKGEATDFAPVLGQILPIASELRVEFNEVSAGLAAMTTTGIDAAEGATRLRAIFSSLLKVTPAQAEAFESVGLSGEKLRASLSEKGLLATLELLKDAVGDNIDVLAAMFPNTRALQGVLALVGQNAENVSNIFHDMEESTGALDKAFKITTEDSAFKMEQAFASLQVAAIQFGEILLPVVRNVTEVLGGLFGAIAELPKPMKDVITLLLSLAAAMGPVLYVFGKAPKLIDNISVAFGRLKAFALHPVVLVITGLVLAFAGLNQIFTASSRRAEEFSGAMTEVSNKFVEAMTRINNSADAAELVRRMQLIAGVMGAFLKQDNAVQKQVAVTQQAVASGFRTGVLSAEEATMAFEALGFTGEELRNRMIGVAGSMEEVNVLDLVDALNEADVMGKRLNADLVVLIDNMAREGVLSSVQYTDALLKAGLTHDQIGLKIEGMSGSLTDLRENVSATGKVIKVFTFATAEDFNEWATDVRDGFQSFITGSKNAKQAFKLTTNQFQRSLEAQAEIAQQAAEDMEVLTELPIPEEFMQFLIDSGPAAIRAFIEGSKPQREAMKESWKDIDKATRDYGKSLDELAGAVIESTVKADTGPARESINQLLQSMEDNGFTLSPKGTFEFGGGGLRHEGGMAGEGRWRRGPLKPGEVASILERGEFVVQRDVVNQPGMKKFLEALNSGRGVGEFHTGGIVGQSRANMLEMQSLQGAVAQLNYAYNRAPDAVARIDVNLPPLDEIIEKLIGSIVGVGVGGLSPNAARYMAVIQTMFGPGIGMGTINRRTILGTSTWSQHAYGNAVDVMVIGELHRAIAMFTDAHRELLSIAHLLADPYFPSPLRNHYNHVHADFNPQGTGTPPPGGGWVGAAKGLSGILKHDTNISAHKGEVVQIGSQRKFEELLVNAMEAIRETMTPKEARDWKRAMLATRGKGETRRELTRNAFLAVRETVTKKEAHDLLRALRESAPRGRGDRDRDDRVVKMRVGLDRRHFVDQVDYERTYRGW